MPGNELKNLSRRELVDIIYQQKRNEEQLQVELTALQAELQDRRIKLSKVGSIAEAAISITDVYTAAQASADLYLREIARLKEETEQVKKAHLVGVLRGGENLPRSVTAGDGGADRFPFSVQYTGFHSLESGNGRCG